MFQHVVCLGLKSDKDWLTRYAYELLRHVAAALSIKLGGASGGHRSGRILDAFIATLLGTA